MRKNENKVLSLFNLSSDTINLKINSENITDHYTRLFTKDKEKSRKYLRGNYVTMGV